MDHPGQVEAYASAAAGEHLDRLDSACARAILETGASAGLWLDAGCGPGQIALKVAARSGGKVIGIDLSAPMLRQAQGEAGARRLRHRVFFVQASASALPFKPKSFDLVYSNSVLHHLPAPGSFFREAAAVLKTSGRFFLRDLVRPPRWRLGRHLRRFGSPYSGSMRCLFEASVAASYTVAEARCILRQSPLDGAVVSEEDGCYLVIRR
jgi:ubiquinone/menaquinone biosynthesis C-methylase UbiE